MDAIVRDPSWVAVPIENLTKIGASALKDRVRV
jgi:hypothetical protein